jgi:membrane associated rhomboid family serine protease
MGYRGPTPGLQSMIPFTKTVKTLVIVNVGIWLVVQVILEQFFMPTHPISSNFGLVPQKVIGQFFIWQPVTYMFLHSTDAIMHIVFNMLLLWWLGAELEMRWGSRFFLLYYMVSGVGAAIIYVFSLTLYALATSITQPLEIPVIGASGAVFGLMLAYGIIFGDRIVYFMFIFPMKAKYFVMILGAIEVVMVLNTGVGSGRVANLAHIGGLVSGFLFLYFWTRHQNNKSGKSKKKNRNLKLVVDNEKKKDEPKYWN